MDLLVVGSKGQSIGLEASKQAGEGNDPWRKWLVTGAKIRFEKKNLVT